MSVGSVIAADAVDVERERRCGGHEEESDKEARERVPKVLLHCCRRERETERRRVRREEREGQMRSAGVVGAKKWFGTVRMCVCVCVYVYKCVYVCVCVCCMSVSSERERKKRVTATEENKRDSLFAALRFCHNCTGCLPKGSKRVCS